MFFFFVFGTLGGVERKSSIFISWYIIYIFYCEIEKKHRATLCYDLREALYMQALCLAYGKHSMNRNLLVISIIIQHFFSAGTEVPKDSEITVCE